MPSALFNKGEQSPLLGTDSQSLMKAGMEPDSSDRQTIDRKITDRQTTDRPETISYTETGDTWRGVENSDLGSLLVKVLQEEVLGSFP